MGTVVEAVSAGSCTVMSVAALRARLCAASTIAFTWLSICAAPAPGQAACAACATGLAKIVQEPSELSLGAQAGRPCLPLTCTGSSGHAIAAALLHGAAQSSF